MTHTVDDSRCVSQTLGSMFSAISRTSRGSVPVADEVTLGFAAILHTKHNDVSILVDLPSNLLGFVIFTLWARVSLVWDGKLTIGFITDCTHADVKHFLVKFLYITFSLAGDLHWL